MIKINAAHNKKQSLKSLKAKRELYLATRSAFISLNSGGIFFGGFALLLAGNCFAVESRTGEQIYATHCAHCHNIQVAPAIWKFPEVLVKTKVRASLLSMPRFSLTEINKQELEVLAEYIQNHPLEGVPAVSRNSDDTSVRVEPQENTK